MIKINHYHNCTMLDEIFTDKFDNEIMRVCFYEQTFIKINDTYALSTLNDDEKDLLLIYLTGLRNAYNYQFDVDKVYKAIKEATKPTVIDLK